MRGSFTGGGSPAVTVERQRRVRSDRRSAVNDEYYKHAFRRDQMGGSDCLGAEKKKSRVFFPNAPGHEHPPTTTTTHPPPPSLLHWSDWVVPPLSRTVQRAYVQL